MITEGKSPVVMGIRDPYTHTHSDFYDSYLKGVYEKAIEAEVDILHIISHSRSLRSPARESSGLEHLLRQIACIAAAKKTKKTPSTISLLLHLKIT